MSRNTTIYEKLIEALQVNVAAKIRNRGDIVWMLKHKKDFHFVHPEAQQGT